MAIHAGLRVSASWKVGTKIADGGMASVWHVTHTEFGETRALKAMHDFLLRDAELSRKFIEEAKNTRRIRHPNVVEVFDAGRVRDPDSAATSGREIPWLVMELLEGHDLAEEMRLRGSSGLPWREVAAIFEQTCAGLDAAHRGGLVHLDLKPENLFVTRVHGEPQIKVVDFGISKLMTGAGHSATLTGKMLSPLWAAPEQIQRTKVGPGTDIWSLGLIAFFLLSGRYYWRAANAPAAGAHDPVTALVNEILQSAPQPVLASRRARELGASAPLPDGFDGWFARCLRYEPSRRFASVLDASRELCALLRPAERGAFLPSSAIGPTEVLRETPLPPRGDTVLSDVSEWAWPREPADHPNKPSRGGGVQRPLPRPMLRKPLAVAGLVALIGGAVVAAAQAGALATGDATVPAFAAVSFAAIILLTLGGLKLTRVLARAVRSRPTYRHALAFRVPALLVVLGVPALLVVLVALSVADGLGVIGCVVAMIPVGALILATVKFTKVLARALVPRRGGVDRSRSGR
ncbi:MAG: serine/threonine-protein kinase [Deltaproteobacteria bacterium]|nr:serine/threonine-protein kinase [Myxococcales bacterium]MDP3212927.1 serine/threonine-protein kinase [Deltaproteobacteria bacterium]